MNENKADTVRYAKKVTGYDDDIQSDEYNDVMPMMSVDMKFNKEATDNVAELADRLCRYRRRRWISTKFIPERFLPTVK